MKDFFLKLYIKAQVLREENGQDMVEYALVVAIIALAATASMTTVAGNIKTLWDGVGAKILGATPA